MHHINLWHFVCSIAFNTKLQKRNLIANSKCPHFTSCLCWCVGGGLEYFVNELAILKKHNFKGLIIIQCSWSVPSLDVLTLSSIAYFCGTQHRHVEPQHAPSSWIPPRTGCPNTPINYIFLWKSVLPRSHLVGEGDRAPRDSAARLANIFLRSKLADTVFTSLLLTRR